MSLHYQCISCSLICLSFKRVIYSLLFHFKLVSVACLSLVLIVTLSPFVPQTAAQCSNICLTGLSSCIGSCRKNCRHYCDRLCKRKFRGCNELEDSNTNCEIYSHGCGVYCYRRKCKKQVCKKCRTSFARCWYC
jgi:hypothetical protein